MCLPRPILPQEPKSPDSPSPHSNTVTQDDRYLYNGANLTVTLNATSLATTQVFLLGLNQNQIFAQDTVGTSSTMTRWALTDHQGTVRDILNNAGTQIDHLQYGSFGNITSQSDTTNTMTMLYTGQIHDTPTNLDYDNARWYDPANGKFISVDPIGFKSGQTDLYVYCANDPIDKTDPTGFQVVNQLPKFAVHSTLKFDASKLMDASKKRSGDEDIWTALSKIFYKDRDPVDLSHGTYQSGLLATDEGDEGGQSREHLIPNTEKWRKGLTLAVSNMYFRSFMHGVATTKNGKPCGCDFSRSFFDAIPFVIFNDAMAMGSFRPDYQLPDKYPYSYIVPGFGTPRHEQLHTDGGSEDIIDQRNGKTVGSFSTLGYAGATKMAIGFAKNELEKYDGPISDSDCQKEVEVVFKKYLIGSDALQRIVDAGSWHQNTKEGKAIINPNMDIRTR